MAKTEVTFWQGLRTIGGNIIEICHGKDRVIFDFGLVYDPAGSLLEQNMHRKHKYVHDLLKLDMIPHIDGLYQERDIKELLKDNEQLITAENNEGDLAVFISHLHIDHMGAIRAISPDVPLYMSETSVDMYKALEAIGEEPKLHRKFNTLKHEETVKIGSIKVTPYRVDHDILGALSLFIETPDLKILYSGDLRMHGKNREWNEKWLDTFRDKNVDILLMEGTTFRPENEETEKTEALCESELDFTKVVSNLIAEKTGIALCNIYHRNIERIEQLVDVATSVNRKLVLEPETAYLAEQFLPENKKDFLVVDLPADNWLKDLEEKYEIISFETINEETRKYFLQNSFHHIVELLDLRLHDAVYLHANGVPLGDFDPNYGKMLAFLEHFNVPFYSVGVSGHATPEDVLDIVEQIKPTILIPWHSHYPELMKPLDKNQKVFLPEEKTTYIFQENNLQEIKNN